MTRAKNALALVHPLRFFIRQQSRLGDRHVFAPRTRFIPDAILDRFDRAAAAEPCAGDGAAPRPAGPRIDVAARLRAAWSS
jgi:DNA helicase-2/ATP-dependent DNA helicase PcrA